MKRLVDILLSSLALSLLGFPILLLAWQVRRKLGGPVFFCQTRPGLHGRPFRMVKFRTMTDARDCDGRLLPDADRLTAFGRFLRASSLDELPELWNVLKGDMSLVGPRPCMERQRALYGAAWPHYTAMRPGLTGLWQVSQRNEQTFAQRVALDVAYVEDWSLWLDCRILMRTVRAVLFDGE